MSEKQTITNVLINAEKGKNLKICEMTLRCDESFSRFLTLCRNSGRRRGNPNSYYQRQRTRHYRHESSDDEDEDEDDSEDESDEECDFETLSNELIDFYQRHGVDWYMTRYGAVGARGMGSRGGGDFCLYFNVNGEC